MFKRDPLNVDFNETTKYLANHLKDHAQAVIRHIKKIQTTNGDQRLSDAREAFRSIEDQANILIHYGKLTNLPSIKLIDAYIGDIREAAKHDMSQELRFFMCIHHVYKAQRAVIALHALMFAKDAML